MTSVYDVRSQLRMCMRTRTPHPQTGTQDRAVAATSRARATSHRVTAISAARAPCNTEVMSAVMQNTAHHRCVSGLTVTADQIVGTREPSGSTPAASWRPRRARAVRSPSVHVARCTGCQEPRTENRARCPRSVSPGPRRSHARPATSGLAIHDTTRRV